MPLTIKDLASNVTSFEAGFSCETEPDYMVETDLMSRQTNAPVKVRWPREHEIRRDCDYAIGTQALEAGADPDEHAAAWLRRTVSIHVAVADDGPIAIRRVDVAVDYMSRSNRSTHPFVPAQART